MDSKQRKQIDKAYQQGRLDGLKAIDTPDEAIAYIEDQWKLLATHSKELNLKERHLEEVRKKLMSAIEDLQSEVERLAIERADHLVGIRMQGAIEEVNGREREVKRFAEELHTIAKNIEERREQLDKREQYMMAEMSALTKKQEALKRLDNIDILKEVLVDLELEENPNLIAVRLRERFGLLIAQR